MSWLRKIGPHPVMLVLLSAYLAPGCGGAQRRGKKVDAQAAKPRPRPREPAALIPPPPYRLDVRVEDKDLPRLPPKPALVMILRPDLPLSLGRELGELWRRWVTGGQLGFLGPLLGTNNLADSLGLRADRAILLAGPALQDEPAAIGGGRPATAPAKKPPLLHFRLIAQVGDAQKLTAALDRFLKTRPGGVLATHHRLTATATGLPKAFAGLSGQGIWALGYRGDPGWCYALAVRKSRLTVDVWMRASGAWTPTAVRRQIDATLAAPDGPAPSGFARTLLFASADLALLIDAPRLAAVAEWLGLQQLNLALPGASAERRPKLETEGKRIARLPREFVSASGATFSNFGFRLFLLPGKPRLNLSWQLTKKGTGLFGKPSRAVASDDLARKGGLVARWLKPVAARLPKVLPPSGPYATPTLKQSLADGGFFMIPLALASFWPRLLTHKPTRKAVLKVLRKDIRPGRFVRRVNVRLRSQQLELIVEGRIPAKLKQAAAPPQR